MIKKLIFMFCSLIASIAIHAQTTLDYYLPEGITYNPEIPKPAEIIGHEVGQFHITHDKLVYYMQTLARVSPRITIEKIGETHEKRPQYLLTITSPENHGKIDQIKQQHKLLVDPSESAKLDINSMPAVVLQGFSIHGNEPSGSNAALITAYHYAAAEGTAIDQLLENLVILLDPSFNPDGLTRFATWANSRRSKNLIADPNNMEQNEYWPGGRTNHYWFDLNRDWMPVQQPEAYNRVVKFHEWKPNVLTDHHEMGTSSTFFFQPGIPSRNNPNTPWENFELTQEIGTYHAKALDKIGSLYFTQESYDDFYYGKGSTFPDINGGIGILFEQASSRGHAQESAHGVLTFPFTIRNQFVTSLSTVEAAASMRTKLLDYQRRFYSDAKAEADKDLNKAIIFGNENDPTRSAELARILTTHEIEVKTITQVARINGKIYPASTSYLVPLNQPQYRLINIMFEEVTNFKDSLFYDVSAWTLPHAFNLNFDRLNAKALSGISSGAKYQDNSRAIDWSTSEYAYVFEWDDYKAPSMLYSLLDAGVVCKVANEPFSAEGKTFDRGSIMISLQIQNLKKPAVESLLRQHQDRYQIKVYPLKTGLTAGVNLGSRTLSTLVKPAIALLVEEGIRSYDAGEVWHLLDSRMDIPVTLIPIRRLNRSDLSRYNTMILVDGNYGSIDAGMQEQIKEWIKKGGHLIAYKDANRWLKQQEIIKVEFVKSNRNNSGPLAYADMENTQGAQLTAGTIFQGTLDLTHPIAYGYNRSLLPVFIDDNLFFETPNNPYAYPFVLDKNKPLLSGYVHPDNLSRLKGTPGIIISRYGGGKVISFSFNTNFRAFWYGTNKLLLNAIFFGDEISSRSANE